MGKPRVRVRLRRIEYADFRCSEQTMYDQLPASFRRTLKDNDAVCFISGSGTQLMFVYGFVSVGMTKPSNPIYTPRRYGIIPSVRLRLTGSTWSPTMLANYADDCGLDLIGIKRFEEYYSKYVGIDEEKEAA